MRWIHGATTAAVLLHVRFTNERRLELDIFRSENEYLSLHDKTIVIAWRNYINSYGCGNYNLEMRLDAEDITSDGKNRCRDRKRIAKTRKPNHFSPEREYASIRRNGENLQVLRNRDLICRFTKARAIGQRSLLKQKLFKPRSFRGWNFRLKNAFGLALFSKQFNSFQRQTARGKKETGNKRTLTSFMLSRSQKALLPDADKKEEKEKMMAGAVRM
ncbi:hypothetical protein TNCV_1166801 [Trichonephila clavipes]|uniref:Uncharacterized protein n=1 Tax=Trichonephila clavipes TaxID=2585209 RepID=A0A8X6VJY0_TRICX|nr:hypothetical protein TNCV_1166801 [Trichonephila clavipes]